MHVLDWPFINALQAGALAVLFLGSAADAIARRDRMMAWLSLACLLVGLRHAALALGAQLALNPDQVDRIQSVLVAAGFIAFCLSLVRLFPRHFPRRFPAWAALGLAPGILRNLVIFQPGIASAWPRHFSNLVYLAACGFILYWIMKARQDGDPLGRRLMLGFMGLTLPVVVETVAFTLFDMRVRLSGFSLLILAMTIGTSWQWLVVRAMEGRIRQTEAEAEAWRSLIPGSTFRTDHSSPAMESLFGPAWAARIKTSPETVRTGSDGVQYRIRSRILDRQERLGWYERDEDAQTGSRGFLSGWTIGLGMDDAAENARIQSLLKAWGAEVETWGTVPPREGPFPSVLIWAREPSILAVWREDGLLRRRPRWVQIGGPVTEGPHVRLDPPLFDDDLRRAFERLLSGR